MAASILYSVSKAHWEQTPRHLGSVTLPENPAGNGRFRPRNPSGRTRFDRGFRFPAGSGQIDPSRTRSCHFWPFFKEPPVDKQFGKIPAEISGGIFGRNFRARKFGRKFRSGNFGPKFRPENGLFVHPPVVRR